MNPPFKVPETCLRCTDDSVLEAILCDDQRCSIWKHRLIEVEE